MVKMANIIHFINKTDTFDFKVSVLLSF